MTESSLNGKKTLWEKEKLLVTSNFSFSRSVLKRLVRQTRKNQGLFGKGLKKKKKLTTKKKKKKKPTYPTCKISDLNTAVFVF